MEINVEDNFTLLFDKNNNTAYKALQMLQKECEKSDKVYCYMDKLADMIDNDNSYIRTRGLTLIAYGKLFAIHSISSLCFDFWLCKLCCCKKAERILKNLKGLMS